jgi:NitT/TauT family transport system substrate-binding protein
VVVTTEKFHNDNPKLYAAIAAAYEEALAFIDANKRAAAEIYVKYEPQKRGVDWIQKILEDENEIKFTSTPMATQVYADFMVRLGTMKNRPDSWKDVYWDNVAGKDGN